MMTDKANPAVYPGETLVQLPGGDYQLSNGEHCWVFTPEEWVEYATEFVADLKASQYLRYFFDRIHEDVVDPAEAEELLHEVGRRAKNTEEGLSNAVRLYMERVKYIDFLREHFGTLPEMPDDWKPEYARVSEDD